jgi:hypothetical protein
MINGTDTISAKAKKTMPESAFNIKATDEGMDIDVAGKINLRHLSLSL